MPRSNPHARERVMDDRKHLDALASFVAFAGHETSVASPAGSSRGSVLHAPANRIGDQEMLETSSSGGSPLASSEAPLRRKEVLDSVRSARADDGSRLQRRGKSSPARLALPPARSLTARGRREPERRQTCPSFSWVVKITRGSRRFVVVCLDRAPARPAGVSEEPSFRKGRAHDRIVVAEVGRTASSSWTHAATGDRSYVTKRNAARGNPRGASERPPDGRRFGSSVPAGTVTGSRGRVVSAPRSQTPPHSGERGSPLEGENRARASEHVERAGGAR
jgi:hypothetical protein